MNANVRKCLLFLLLRRRRSNNNNLRIFALTCKEALMQWAHGCARTAICGKFFNPQLLPVLQLQEPLQPL